MFEIGDVSRLLIVYFIFGLYTVGIQKYGFINIYPSLILEHKCDT